MKPGEEPAEGIRRVAFGRIEDALEQLRDFDKRPAEAVHEARKDLKKLRSLLRLVRDEVGEETYARESRRYRDAGRRLSAARDAEVKLETIQALRKVVHLDGIDAYVAVLEEERSRGETRTEALAEAIAAIEAGREEISSWRLPGSPWKPSPGITRAYRRGRKELAAVQKDPADEAVHDWRKRAKDLWYHLRLLCSAWPEVLEPFAGQAHQLADSLGDHHDLSVLAEDAQGRDSCFEDPDARADLLAAIAKRQDQLLAAAIDRGERLYAEKPKAFAARLDTYWAH
jgi:CHAD domain-containing protein